MKEKFRTNKIIRYNYLYMQKMQKVDDPILSQK
jgi:hypothetical protein